MKNDGSELFRINCECGAELEVSPSDLGRTVRCGACGREIVVSMPGAPGRVWYYMAGSERVGPVPGGRMQELFDSGALGAQTPLWTESMPDWAPAWEVGSFRIKAPVVARPKETSTLRTVLMVLIPVIIIMMVGVFGLVAAIMLPALAKARESARRSACVNNLKQMGLIMNMYANENKERYPTIDSVKGNFMFEGDQVFPEYLTDAVIAVCPSDPGYDPATAFRLRGTREHPGSTIGRIHPDCITCESYIYLGWTVTNEEEGLAAIRAYRRASTAELDENLRVPEGKGTGGGDHIYRLRTGGDRFLVTDVRKPHRMSAPGEIPVMWEWPYNHVPAGGNVLYLDGHVEFIRYPGKFPMSKGFIEELSSFEPELSPDVPPIVDTLGE